MFGIAGTAELSTFCPGTGTWNRLQDGIMKFLSAQRGHAKRQSNFLELPQKEQPYMLHVQARISK